MLEVEETVYFGTYNLIITDPRQLQRRARGSSSVPLPRLP